MSTSLMSVARLFSPRLLCCQSSKSFSVSLGNVSRNSYSLSSSRFTNHMFLRSSFSTESESKESTDPEAKTDPVNNKNEKKKESKEELLKKDIEELSKKLKLKDKDLTKARNDVLRTLADMENLRQRSQRDNKQVRNFAVQSFAKSLLDVADNLQLAIQNSKKDVEEEVDNKSLKVLFEGITMTEKTLTKALKKHHVTKFDSLDTKFDPNKHEGVFQFPDPTRKPGMVGNVLKEGYMLRDRVLRPAQVGTVMAPPPEPKVDASEANEKNSA